MKVAEDASAENSTNGSAGARDSGRWSRLAAELASLIYIAVIAVIAGFTGAFYILFPELGALSHDVFTRPRGTWASAPLLLAITPFLTGVIGIFFTRAPRKDHDPATIEAALHYMSNALRDGLARDLRGLVDFLGLGEFEMRARQLHLDDIGAKLRRDLSRISDHIEGGLAFLA